ncbi:hypothetical protein [Pantanalinema sp. GBBB05]|uniref:hypothetical protein n=1 Tax=Pantanalinema sp. GBBB05 TaxID=2604139 RepID=UPI001D87490F|nr:hypothetical protein [Pantanalinema sp. GBBB05]
MQQPKATDGILGGQTPPPIASAVLGGIAGLRQQMTLASPEQRSQLLPTALNYGEAGITLLISLLNNDPVLTVRATAYQHLQQAIAESSTNIREMQQAIAKGVPLKQGDRLYRVHISAIDYDDEYYTLLDSVQAYEAHDFCYEGEQLHPVERYIFQEQAEQVAADLHRIILSNGNLAEFNQRHQLKLNPLDYYLLKITEDLCNFYRNGSQPVHEWCTAHEIDVDLSDYLDEGVFDDDEDEGWYWWEAQEEVLQHLQSQKNYPLLEEFCDLVGMGRFTFVHEEIVDREGYFPVMGTLT